MSKTSPVKYFVTSEAELDTGLWGLSGEPHLFDDCDAALASAKEAVDCGSYEEFVVEARLVHRVLRGKTRVTSLT